jgi:predicted GH43/DUF377 family glycosyl hydrolase
MVGGRLFFGVLREPISGQRWEDRMKTGTLFATFAVALGMTVALLWCLGNQSQPAVAAPLASVSTADWDGLSINVPTVISATGKYHMWYSGRGFSFQYYTHQSGLGYAESADGKDWDVSPANPILRPGQSGKWDDYYRGQVAVIYDEGQYKMWYSGGRTSGAWQTGYATSADGLDWSIYAGNPVLHSGAAGSWDEQESDGPTVIKDGAGYKMWYHACNADYSVCSIGYATSPDGIDWTKFAGNPVLESTPGTWDASGLLWPRVVKNGATYEMWYYCNSKIGRAISSNGTDWTKDANPVLSEGWGGIGIKPISLLLEGGAYKMWSSSGVTETLGIGYLESTNGITWTQPISNPVLAPGEAGVIIDVNYEIDRVGALTFGDTPIAITVSHAGAVKATIGGVTDSWGWFYSDEDWNPMRPDIEPGDTISATANGFSALIETVGEIGARAHSTTDLVEGTIDAPWPGSLSVLCLLWNETGTSYLDMDVPADGGSFACDFSGMADIVGGLTGRAGYLEPDGDMVSVEFTGPHATYLPLVLRN